MSTKIFTGNTKVLSVAADNGGGYAESDYRIGIDIERGYHEYSDLVKAIEESTGLIMQWLNAFDGVIDSLEGCTKEALKDFRNVVNKDILEDYGVYAIDFAESLKEFTDYIKKIKEEV